MLVAIDFGITNTDVVINEAEKNKFYTFPTKKINENFIGNILDTIELNTSKISNIAVTGGKSSDLKDSYNNIPITKINEDRFGYKVVKLPKPYHIWSGQLDIWDLYKDKWRNLNLNDTDFNKVGYDDSNWANWDIKHSNKFREGSFKNAFKAAAGMSFISMIAMEVAMNLTDYILTGGAILTWWVIPIMLIVGFLTPWPYNYYILKRYNKSCH